MAENSLGREPLSRRELGKLIEATLGSVVFAPVLRTPEQIILPPPQDYLRIGDVAPDWWGGARKSEIITAYVHADNFTGQVRIYASEPTRSAQVVICGQDAQGNIIKGFNYLTGEEKVRVSTSGLGLYFPPADDDPEQSGGYLSYSPATLYDPRILELGFNNFLIQSPDTPEVQKVSFNIVSVTDPDKTRVLSGTDFDEDTIRYYLRVGDRDPTTGNPNLLMVAHTNIREITDSLKIPEHPIVGFDPQGYQLYIAQKDIVKQGHHPLVWLSEKPWMQDPEKISAGINTQIVSDESLNYKVPERIIFAYGGQGWDDISPDKSKVVDFSLLVNIPNIDFTTWGKKNISFATLPATLAGNFAKEAQIYLMLQANALRSYFLPQLEGSGSSIIIPPPPYPAP